jgi:hypothetical protein
MTLSIVKLRIMPRNIRLSVINAKCRVFVFAMLCVITLSVITLNVIMVSVVAPIRQMEGQTYEEI